MVTGEDVEPSAGIEVARIAPRAGVIMRLLSARIQGRIDGHAPMVGAPRGPGAITLAC